MRRTSGSQRKRGAIILLCLLGWGERVLTAYPLSPAQEHRLEQYLPRTLLKLQRQIPIHVALIGDEVAGMRTLDERNGNFFYSLPGYFLQGVEREFFYTGGIKWLNPPGDLPAKLHGHRGNEISLESFTTEGATSLHALQALTTRVFLRPTDLVLLQVGLNDYRNGTPLETVAISVVQAMAICKAQGAELVLIGPAPFREGELLQDWGGIRQVASELRRAAEKLGILFLDPALELMRTRPASGEVGIEERTTQLSSALGMDLLDYGPGKIENARINARAHKRAGHGIFKQFLNGNGATKLRLTGQATRIAGDRMKVDLTVENPGSLEESGLLVPLVAGGDWAPVKAAEAVVVNPGAATSLCVEYQRKKAADTESLPRRERVTSGWFCFPFLYSGLDDTELLELVLSPGPVSVRWGYTVLRDVEKQFPITFTLSNPGTTTVRGSYEIAYDRQRAKGNFVVDGQSERQFTAQCVLPETESQFRRRDPLILKIVSGEVAFEERRCLEATRNLALAQKIPLARRDRYAEDGTDGRVDAGVNLEVRADAESLWATFDLGDRALEEARSEPALRVELTLDGRPNGERHEFGFVHPLRVAFGAQPGEGKVFPIEPASFGNFYGKILSEEGVKAHLGIGEDGSRKVVTVRVPRIYFYRHDWGIGKANSTLGFSARLRILRVDPQQQTCDYPASQDWITTSPEFGEFHAAGLAGLEMDSQPSSRWAVRLY